jgi:hypothetical protein
MASPYWLASNLRRAVAQSDELRRGNKGGWLAGSGRTTDTVGHNDQMAKIIYRASSKPKIEIVLTMNHRTIVYNFS